MIKKLISKLALIVAVVFGLNAHAQTILFSENMGSPAATTPIASNTFQNSSLCFSGTGDMRSTQASSGYTGASGGGNAFLTTTAGKYFQIGCIDASACSSMTLSFGVYKSVTTTNTDLQVSFSTDGGLSFGAPVTMTLTGGAAWSLQTISSGIPSSNNLAIRFTNTNSASQYRIDDVSLSGSCSACTPPTIQASALTFSAVANNSLTLDWVRGNGTNVIILASQGSAVSANPSNGTVYTANSIFGSGSQIGSGNYVVYDGSGTSVNVTGLTAGTTYYFSVYEYNTTTGTPCYLNPAVQSNTTTTGVVPCMPSIQSSNFSTTSLGTTSATVSWTSGDGTNVLVVVHPVNASTFTPVNGITYNAPTTDVYGATTVANGTVNVYSGSYVAYNGVNTNSLTITNLNPGSTYYFTIFEYGISGTPCYLTPALTGSIMPLATPVATTCLQIKSVLVDACDGTSEPKNEMVYFKTGSNPLATNQLSIAGAPRNGVFAANKWPNNNNAWRGIIQDALTASNVSAINASITKCGYVLEPPLVAGIPTIPANKNVILVGSEDMSPAANSFANLTDTIYMIFQTIYTGTTSLGGNFANWGSSTDGTRGLVLIDGGNACTSNTVTYEPQLLLNHSDGDGASYNDNNTIAYYNNGCQAPFTPLTVSASPNQTVCFNSVAVVTATPSGVYTSLTWTGGTGTFSSPSAITTSYTPGAGETGNIQLTCVISRTCSAGTFTAGATTAVFVTSLPLYSFNASNGYSLCPSATSVISYSVSNAANAGVLTPSWSSPAGSGTTYTVSAPGGTTSVTYTLDLANSCGSTVKTFTVYPLALPTVTLSAQTLTACVGNTLSLSASGNTGNYSWSNPVSTNSTVVITAGSSTTGAVSSTNTCGTATDSYTLTVTPNPTLSVSNSNVSLCTGQSATVTATSSIGTYTWMPGSINSNSIVVNASGTHTVYSGNACQTASATVDVVMSAAASLTISSTSNTLCASGQTAVLSASGSSGTYQWSDGASTSTISISTPGVYSATVTTPGCGSAVDSYTVNAVQIPTISVNPTSTLLCDGQTGIITATSNMNNYNWSTGAVNVNTVSVNASGIYTVGVSNACGVASASVSVTTVNSPTLVLAVSSLSICPNETATLTVSGGDMPYVWSNSSNTGSVVTTSGGTVAVTYSNACGADTQTLNVVVAPVNAAISANPTSGTKPLIVNFTNNSIGAISYNWNFGNGNSATTQTVSSQTYSVSGNYWVSLTVSNGVCSDVDSLMITVNEDEPWIIIPNVFTPNGDTANDIFKITGYYHISEFNCTIFDRWGLQMFEWSEIKEGWDGTSDGNKVPDGTYFYIINAKDIDGKEIKKQGAILLIR